jgi:hypothetical protein
VAGVDEESKSTISVVMSVGMMFSVVFSADTETSDTGLVMVGGNVVISTTSTCSSAADPDSSINGEPVEAIT